MSSSPSTNATPRGPRKTVLVTGAGGFIGFEVSRAFARAGWDVFGLIRRPAGADALRAEEITPLVGSISADLGFLDDFLARPSTRPLDVVVSCTEHVPFDEHWAHLGALLGKVAEHYHRTASKDGRDGSGNGSAEKPLVLMSSGCKDYGQTLRHGEPGLAPHTEASPLDPTPLLAPRTDCTLRVFDEANRALYDAAVIRPTPLHGYAGSYYGVLFSALQAAKDRSAADGDGDGNGKKILVPGHPDNIYHGCHVDDCAAAYVALAAHPDRGAVGGEAFNVSGYRYETVREVLDALARELGIPRDTLAHAPLADVPQRDLRALEPSLGYSQWVDSSKIRRLTGWADAKPLFSENVPVYRRAFDAAASKGDEGVKRIRERVAGWAAAGLSFERE